MLGGGLTRQLAAIVRCSRGGAGQKSAVVVKRGPAGESFGEFFSEAAGSVGRQPSGGFIEISKHLKTNNITGLTVKAAALESDLFTEGSND